MKRILTVGSVKDTATFMAYLSLKGEEAVHIIRGIYRPTFIQVIEDIKVYNRARSERIFESAVDNYLRSPVNPVHKNLNQALEFFMQFVAAILAPKFILDARKDLQAVKQTQLEVGFLFYQIFEKRSANARACFERPEEASPFFSIVEFKKKKPAADDVLYEMFWLPLVIHCAGLVSLTPVAMNIANAIFSQLFCKRENFESVREIKEYVFRTAAENGRYFLQTGKVKLTNL